MTDKAIQTLAAQIVKGLTPMIEGIFELRELKQIGKEPTTGFLTHRDFQTWMSQRGLSLTNGHEDDPQFFVGREKTKKKKGKL
jgi:hypothetical protein